MNGLEQAYKILNEKKERLKPIEIDSSGLPKVTVKFPRVWKDWEKVIAVTEHFMKLNGYHAFVTPSDNQAGLTFDPEIGEELTDKLIEALALIL